MFDISHQSLNAQNDVVVVTPAVVPVEASIGRLAESELEIFQNFCMLFAVHCDKKYLWLNRENEQLRLNVWL